MEVGDLVRHRIDGSFGIVLESRGENSEMVRVYWYNHNFTVLHTSRQVEVIDEV